MRDLINLNLLLLSVFLVSSVGCSVDDSIDSSTTHRDETPSASEEPSDDGANLISETPLETAQTEEEVIYGADDRRDYYELTDPIELQVADSTVAVLDTSSLTSTSNGYRVDTSQSFGSAYALCSSEPYRDQPTSAFCTGFQVGEDLIATAGHCIDSSSCGGTAFAFGFHMISSNQVRRDLPDNDLYFCQEVIARAETNTNDFAVIRVDRAITGHSALEIRREGQVSLRTALFVSGHPAGIPLKVAGGATVRSNSQSQYFDANLDTYGGNSGSPIVNLSGVVEGILVRGNTDFKYKRKQRCYQSNVCSDSGCRGWESATRITQITTFVPEGPVTPPTPDCTMDSECTDGDPCNGAESCVSGQCVGGDSVSCMPANDCLSSSCQATSDTEWTCQDTEVSCDDGDPCTVNGCDPNGGCFSSPLCSADQVCDGGVCSDPVACQPYRSSCQSNSDCCSLSCHPRKKWCR